MPACPGVFLSHTWPDKPFVRRLAADLEAAGARVWLDEAEIKLGDSLIEKIREGIDAVDYLAVVPTPRAVASEWVKREVNLAMMQEIRGKRVKVLPLLYENCEMPGFLEEKSVWRLHFGAEHSRSLEQVLDRLGLRQNRNHSKSGTRKRSSAAVQASQGALPNQTAPSAEQDPIDWAELVRHGQNVSSRFTRQEIIKAWRRGEPKIRKKTRG